MLFSLLSFERDSRKGSISFCVMDLYSFNIVVLHSVFTHAGEDHTDQNKRLSGRAVCVGLGTIVYENDTIEINWCKEV